MMKTDRISMWVLDAVLLAGLMVGAAFSTPGQDKKTSGCEAGGKQWLALMDTDHDGTVSMREFQNYMSAEFKKADADHDGTLDAKELAQLRGTLSCRD